MILGILSDTHGRADAAAAAIALLKARGAAMFIHCGDVGSQQVLDHFVGLRACFVWGNCDYDRANLERYANALGITCYGSFGDLELAGQRIALLHGDDYRLKQRILEEQRHDYLLQGHTHVAEDQRIGRIRCINPGALYRANPKTAALLNLETDACEWLTVT